MSNRHRDKGKLPPFIALFRQTIKSPAWKAASVGARATFFELKANYNTKAQNAVFLSGRNGAKTLNAHRDTVQKWLRELEHYGFIVKIRGAHLGLEGVGKAALYRLTDCGYAGQPATYDFQNWDGVLFDPKKQNPGPRIQPPRPKKPAISSKAEMPECRNKRPIEPAIRNAEGWPTEPAITSFTSSLGSEAELVLPLSSKPQLAWSTPTLTEIEYTPELRRLYELGHLKASPYLIERIQRRQRYV
jgi:hypothetical protein